MLKRPNPTDKRMGGRLRMRRKMHEISQTNLGDALGVAFQQVQKYEKGTRTKSARAGCNNCQIFCRCQLQTRGEQRRPPHRR